MSDAGKRHVSGRNKITGFRGVSISFTALSRRCLRVDIEYDGDRWIGKLRVGDMHDIAPKNYLFSLAFQSIETVSRRVSRTRNRSDSRKQLGAAIKGLDFTSVNVRFHLRHRLAEIFLPSFFRLLQVGGVKPEIDLPFI